MSHTKGKIRPTNGAGLPAGAAKRDAGGSTPEDAHAVDQQHDAEDALYREHGASDRMRMPHERDESATENADGGKAPSQAEVIGQAQSDLAHGLQDTDCRSVPREGLQQGSDACPGRSGSKKGKDDSWHVKKDG